VRGRSTLTPESLTPGQLALLGIGTTLGIVAQTVALLPSLRAAGFSLRPRWDFRELGLRRVGGSRSGCCCSSSPTSWPTWSW
jgi:putative peptidoglycan lipid II flippase